MQEKNALFYGAIKVKDIDTVQSLLEGGYELTPKKLILLVLSFDFSSVSDVHAIIANQIDKENLLHNTISEILCYAPKGLYYSFKAIYFYLMDSDFNDLREYFPELSDYFSKENQEENEQHFFDKLQLLARAFIDLNSGEDFLKKNLILAAKMGLIELVDEILDKNPELVCLNDKHSNTLLMLALKYGHRETASLILTYCDTYPDILNRLNTKKETALYLSVFMKFPEIEFKIREMGGLMGISAVDRINFPENESFKLLKKEVKHSILEKPLEERNEETPSFFNLIESSIFTTPPVIRSLLKGKVRDYYDSSEHLKPIFEIMAYCCLGLHNDEMKPFKVVISELTDTYQMLLNLTSRIGGLYPSKNIVYVICEKNRNPSVFFLKQNLFELIKSYFFNSNGMNKVFCSRKFSFGKVGIVSNSSTK